MDPEALTTNDEPEPSTSSYEMEPIAPEAPPALVSNTNQHQPSEQTPTHTPVAYTAQTAADLIGPPPTESPRKPHQSHFRHPSAPSPTTTPARPSGYGAGTGLASPANITSPFQLTSSRPFITPPSPKTVKVPDQGYIPDAPTVPEQDETEIEEEVAR